VATTLHTTNALNMPMDGSTVVWAAVPNGNQGDAVAEDWITAYFQVTGTFGAAGSVQMEGSNDGVNWIILPGTAALTAAGFFAPMTVNVRPKYIRPNVTAGDGTTALTITGFLKKHRTGSV
jgi:hypothetical protein